MIVTYERNGRTYSADTDKLSATSIAYLLQYGWSQSLQDSIAGRAKKVRDEYVAKAQADNHDPDDEEIAEAIEMDLDGQLSKRADSIIAGTMNERSPRQDPFEAMCLKIAAEMLAGALKATKQTLKRDSDKWKELLTQVRAKHSDKIEAEAKRRQESVEVIEIDI